jgi:hypothetical protein
MNTRQMAGSEVDVNGILNRVKDLTSMKNDRALALLFGVKPNTLSGWRERNSMSYERLFAVCEVLKLDMNFVVLNREPAISAAKLEIYLQMLDQTVNIIKNVSGSLAGNASDNLEDNENSQVKQAV